MTYQLHHIYDYNVLLVPVKDSNVIFVQSYILSGRMNEGKKNSGISHLLEHVLTESWKKCKNDCAKYWGKKGIITNASTGDATINYYIEGLVKNSEEIIEYIVKITTDPQIRDSRITVEKKAVYEELSRELNDSSWKISHKITDYFYNLDGLKNGNNTKLQIRNLKHITKKDLVNYCKKVYTPRNILFVVAGNFNKPKILTLFKQFLPKNTLMGAKNLKQNILSKITKPKICFIKEKNTKTAEVVFSFMSNIQPNDIETCYFTIITEILSGSMHSLFMRRLRSELHLIYNINVYIEADITGTLTTIETTIDPEKVEQLIKEVTNILRYVCEGNINEDQLNRVKDVFLINEDKKCKNTFFYGNYYADQFMSQLYKRKPKILTYSDRVKIINKVTKDDIIHLCQKIFKMNECLVVYQASKKVH